MRIAIAQTPGTRLDQWRETLTLTAELIGRAAELRAELVVLPECVWPAYHLGSRSAYFAARAAGLPAPDAFVQHLTRLAQARPIAICAGYVEERGDRLTNAACLIDAAGRMLGVHRKCFLWDFDHAWFDAGEVVEPIPASFGRAGVLICADARLPEIPATLAARGAELLLQPTAWVNAGEPGVPWNPQPEFLIPARAAEFGVPTASASKWGVEGDTTFVGSSLICDATGTILARCGPRETTVIAADVEPAPARRPAVTAAERARLVSPAAPATPRADVQPIALLPLPRGASGPHVAEFLRATASVGQAVLGLAPPGGGRPDNPWRVDPNVVVISGPLGVPIELQGVRVGATTAADATRFAPVRCLALQAVHLVLVYGDNIATSVLGTRACENRIWLVAAGSERWCAIDPRGCLHAEGYWPTGPDEATPIQLAAASAAEKCVVARTHVLAGRRPAQYAF